MGGMMGGQAYPQQGMGMSMSRPGSRPPTRPGSAMGSPTPPVEWAIPQTKRVAYSAQFQVSFFLLDYCLSTYPQMSSPLLPNLKDLTFYCFWFICKFCFLKANND